MREHYAAAAKERQREGGAAEGGAAGGKAAHGKVMPKRAEPSKESQSLASEQAGHALGVSRQSVDRARVVTEHGTPELVSAVANWQHAISWAKHGI